MFVSKVNLAELVGVVVGVRVVELHHLNVLLSHGALAGGLRQAQRPEALRVSIVLLLLPGT